jgi:hypothetical protein
MSTLRLRLKVLGAGLVTATLALPLAAAPPPQFRPAPVRMPVNTPAQSAALNLMRYENLTLGRVNPAVLNPAVFGMRRFAVPARFGYGSMMMAPYSGGYMMSGYGGGYPYPMPAYGYGAPQSGGGSPSQAAGFPEDMQERQLYARSLEELRQAKSASAALTAAGVPNDQGRLRWPGGLLALPGTEASELRQQIDALFDEEAQQAQSGPANGQLNQELAGKVKALRQLLRRDKEERFSLPYGSYEQSEQFLAKLARAGSLLKGGGESPREK